MHYHYFEIILFRQNIAGYKTRNSVYSYFGAFKVVSECWVKPRNFQSNSLKWGVTEANR